MDQHLYRYQKSKNKVKNITTPPPRLSVEKMQRRTKHPPISPLIGIEDSLERDLHARSRPRTPFRCVRKPNHDLERHIKHQESRNQNCEKKKKKSKQNQYQNRKRVATPPNASSTTDLFFFSFSIVFVLCIVCGFRNNKHIFNWQIRDQQVTHTTSSFR